MSDQNLLTRREFTVEWVLAVLAGATITITGCGGDETTVRARTRRRRPAIKKGS